jgi:hypothetical protein
VLQRPLEPKQYTSWAFTKRALDSGLVPSMGSIGDCYDNAMMESFWGRMQTELLNRQRWRTRLELANAIFECLEIFHNRQRRHSALGMLTPIEYELRGPNLKAVAENQACRLHGSRGTSGIGPNPVRFIPHCGAEQVLEPVGAETPGVRGDLPPVLPLDWTAEAAFVIQRAST